MPTPRSPEAPPSVITRYMTSVNRTCPPEDTRPTPIPIESRPGDGVVEAADSDAELTTAATSPSSPETPPPTRHDAYYDNAVIQDGASPMSISDEALEDAKQSPRAMSPISATMLLPQTLQGREPTPAKTIPKYTSSFLRDGSKFVGTQQSDRQVYNVQVEIKKVDMSESTICGYLKIEGLTADHPTLTTFFEGEIIGQKHSFYTKYENWNPTDKKTDFHLVSKVDFQHWNRFPAFRPLARAAKSPEFTYKDFAEKEHVFMRWKEYFLVPDHKVTSISGASFEGFYYICFNQVKGTVSGIYFHSKSEKFQQLELKHIDDRGCMGAMEFR